VFRHHFGAPLASHTKDKRHRLAEVIEREVNRHIYEYRDLVEGEVREHKRQMQAREQTERERRLNEAHRTSILEMNTAKRHTQKEVKRNRVIGKLSVLIGNNRKGEIIIRDGDNLL
jgi:DNA helicase TIP49 (TBP-interacting protein)